MRIHHPSRAGLVAAALAMLAITGCSPETGAPEGPASAVDRVSAESAALESPPDIEAEQETARLPEGFPADFPLPPDFTVTSGQFTEGSYGTQANFLVRGTSAASVTEIATFYHDQLPQAGYKVQQWQPIVPDMDKAVVHFHGDAYKNCSVQLADSNGSTNVLISLPLRH